jgi:transposase
MCGSGSKQYPPQMMPALFVYRHANGVFGSRRIERATYRDIAVRYLRAYYRLLPAASVRHAYGHQL